MLTIWLTLAIVFLILAVFAMRRLSSRPVAYRKLLLADTSRFLDDFLRQLDVGSLFVLERESGSGFLQIVLTDRSGEHAEIEFGLPDAGWCRGKFDLVYKAMETAGQCSVETDAGNKAIPRFLRVRIQGSRRELSSGLIPILSLAAGQLGFNSSERYTLRMKGQFSSEYLRELAEQMEQMPREGGRIGGALAARMRRLANRDQRG